MPDFLNVNTIAITILGYPMSYVELVGTVFYLWSVWLIAKQNILTWPVGIISVILYMALFYQIRLYSDTLEQVYYLGASVYGWWLWSTTGPKADKTLPVQFSHRPGLLIAIGTTLLLSLTLGWFFGRVHLWLPAIFPEPASFPYLDALTTVMSFTAMWLMARKRIESWVYWIIVDIIGIWLYFVKDVRFLSVLYVILLAIAIKGLWEWMQSNRNLVTSEPFSDKILSE